jgi:hypothetical protein
LYLDIVKKTTKGDELHLLEWQIPYILSYRRFIPRPESGWQTNLSKEIGQKSYISQSVVSYKLNDY